MIKAVEESKKTNDKSVKFFRKYHKWVSIVLSIFILVFVVSGIVLNHRDLLASFDVDRNNLPEKYEYNNWNSAAVKSYVKLGGDSILVYGNIGIWLTTDNYKTFTEFNEGFPKGVDNHKIEVVFKTKAGYLYAGTLFGLYKYTHKWKKITLPIHEERIVGFTQKKDSLYVLSRSFLLQAKDDQKASFIEKKLPAADDYDNKVSLFKTLWVIHSGEIYGFVGKLIVDFIGLIFAFLTITGILYFVIPLQEKKLKKQNKETNSFRKTRRWSLKWHNKLGWILLPMLVLTTITGMFLRPPLLIPIGNSKVGKIPFTELDADNPWFDNLRKIYYDEELKRFILISGEGKIYYSEDDFNTELNAFGNIPPVSVMGINVFEFKGKGTYLIGSFSGLFEWSSKTGTCFNYITGEPYKPVVERGSPIGENAIAGFTADNRGNEYLFDFNTGVAKLSFLRDDGKRFSKMPSEIKNQAMSLWNLSLELHTGRYFSFAIGPFYILIVPLIGFSILFILVSGFIVWWKKYKK